MANFIKMNQSKLKLETPNTKPAMEEKTTLTANLALVISRKSRYIDFREIVLVVAFNFMVLGLNFCKYNNSDKEKRR